MTVSRSGQMRNPQRSKSSAVFTTTESSPGASASSRPAASFAPPTPPARASTLTGRKPGREEPDRVLVGHGVRQVRLAEPLPAGRFEPGLLLELALGGAQELLSLGAAALGYLPGVPLERVAVLADEVDVVVLHGEDPDGDVLVVHDAVDAGLAVRAYYLVLAHGDPGVLVDPPRRDSPPRARGLLRRH